MFYNSANPHRDMRAQTTEDADKLRVLVVSNAQPRFIWRLAERLRNEVPGVSVCGVVCVRQETKSRNSMLARFQALLPFVGNTLLAWMHAWPGRRNGISNFTEEDLRKCGSKEGWQPVSVCRASLALEFVQSRRPDLCVVLGDLTENEVINEVCQLGAIIIRVPHEYSSNLLNPKRPAQEISVDIQHMANAPATGVNDLSAKIPIELYDTPTSLLLKTNLVATDLAIEAVTRIITAKGKAGDKSEGGSAQDPLPHLSYWQRRNYSKEELFARYARAFWKLCLIQALLFPYILIRNWYRRFRGRFPVTILFHHLISDVPHRLGMPTDVLYREIEFLAKHYRIASLSEAVRMLKSGVISEPTVVLTFDDGYQENFITLRAVLEATGVPVSMFVCSQVVGDQSHFLHDDQPGVHSDFVSLNWDQVAYFHRAGIEIGSHTRSHFDCGSPVSTILEEEIAGSQHDLEGHLNAPVPFFAFPFGKPENISPQAITIAASCYEYFLSASNRDNFPARDFAQRQLMRKGLPNNCWELELTLQSALDLRENIKLSLNRRVRQLHPFEIFAAGDVDEQVSAL